MRAPIQIAVVTTIDLTLRFIFIDWIRALRKEGFEVTAISAPGPWVAELEAEGIRHIPWPHATRSWDPVADAKAFAALVRILSRERFDLVHTATPKAAALGRLAARLTGVPVIVNTHFGFYASRDDPLGKRLFVYGAEAFGSSFSDMEIYGSQTDLRLSRRLGLVTGAKTRFIGMGVDLSRFHPGAISDGEIASLKDRLGIPAGALIVGTVSRLVEDKGIRELVAAARRVRSRIPGVRFVVVGGEEPGKTRSISKQSISDDVVVTGYQRDVRPFVSMMDVFVLVSWREAGPTFAALEAAAMGKPLVVSDIPPFRELVRAGQQGWLVPLRDSAALAQTVERLLADPHLRERLGKAARTTVEERYDLHPFLERFVGEHRTLLERKGLLQAGRAGGRAVRPPIRIAVVTTVDLTLRFIFINRIKALQAAGFEVTAVSAPGPWVADLAAEGIRHIAWPHITRAWDLVADARAFVALVRLLRRERFDLVHTATPKAAALGRLAARLTGVPVIVNSFTGFYAGGQDPLWKRGAVYVAEATGAALSDLELYMSRPSLRVARRLGIDPRKMRFIGSGVDLASFHPSAVSERGSARLRRDLGIPDGALVVGTIARLVGDKGLRELLAAVARVRTKLPSTRLLIVGGDEPGKRDRLDVSAIRDQAIVTGFTRDVRPFLAITDVFALASYRENGAAMACLEAAAMAKPLVLSDIQPFREFAHDEQEALFVPVRDPDALARTLERLLADPHLRERLGKAARTMVEERYHLPPFLERFVGEHRALLQRKGLLGSASTPTR